MLIIKVAEAGRGGLLQDSFSSKPSDGSAGTSPQTQVTHLRHGLGRPQMMDGRSW